jgi:uronate dehydrogenase
VPLQNAEDYADELLLRPNRMDEVGRQYQGGGMASDDFTPIDKRP